MMKPIKERNPDVNIVAIDYDASATRVNQENRLKLMLANAKRRLFLPPPRMRILLSNRLPLKQRPVLNNPSQLKAKVARLQALA